MGDAKKDSRNKTKCFPLSHSLFRIAGDTALIVKIKVICCVLGDAQNTFEHYINDFVFFVTPNALLSLSQAAFILGCPLLQVPNACFQMLSFPLTLSMLITVMLSI